MATQSASLNWVSKLARVAVVVAMPLLAMALIVSIAGAVVAAMSHESWMTVGIWVLGALAAVTMGIWVFVAYGIVETLVANERAVTSAAGRLDRAESLLQDQTQSTKKLIELAGLSDQAKSLIYRDVEIDAIRESIHEDIMRQDYRAAEALLEDIEKKLGYADVAARLREEVAASRKRTLEEQIDVAVTRITEIIDRHDWVRAFREAQRLLQMFAGNPKVESLPERVTKARGDHKRALLEAYGEAVRVNDVDKSIELLKELDVYLTPQEAAALQESARGVFRAKLHNLGVRFAISVSDERWADALTTGQQIVEEFPNSRMAQEVREKLELLRSKAAAVENQMQAKRD